MFLDEPTTGLDPRSRNQVWDIVRALVGEGTTVLLCTQYLDEADQLADRIAVIDHGRVIAEGTPGAAQGVGRRRARCTCACSSPSSAPSAERVLARDARRAACTSSPTRRRCRSPVADAERAAEAVAELSGAGIAVADFSLGQPSLDEVFLALTGHPAEDADGTEAAA